MSSRTTIFVSIQLKNLRWSVYDCPVLSFVATVTAARCQRGRTLLYSVALQPTLLGSCSSDVASDLTRFRSKHPSRLD